MDIIASKQYCESSHSVCDFLQQEGQNIWVKKLSSVKFDCIPPSNLSFNSDSNLFMNSQIPHLYDLEHEAGQVGLVALSDITLATPHGLLFDKKHRLIAESYHNRDMVKIPLREVQTMLSEGLLKREPSEVIELPATLLLGPWSWIYHHWLIEDLSRLWVFDYFPELRKYPVIVPGDLTHFHIASLDALGVNKKSSISFDGSNWRFKKLFIPTFLAPGGHSRRQLDWLRRKLLNTSGAKIKEAGKRRLYVSRSDAKARRILNEEEVIKFVKSYNFEVINPGDFTFIEQISIFSNAEIICGSGGSGITNHIFAPTSATLIEIQPDTYINRAHWFSSNALGQKYLFVIGNAGNDQHDYFVSTPKLKTAIDMATIKHNF